MLKLLLSTPIVNLSKYTLYLIKTDPKQYEGMNVQ